MSTDRAISYDQAVTLSPLIRRITAANGGPMTGPGTNSYLIGNETLALIDPGPAIPQHIDNILNTVGDRLKWILVTHTHRDHSPATQPIAAATGAEVIGNMIADDGFQDASFSSDRELAHNDIAVQTSEMTIRAILTPGHVANHICYLVEEEGGLFTGDHLMAGSTVVIIPPAGSMTDYIQSLRLLQDYSLDCIFPGHGGLIHEPQAEISRIIAHRLQREQKVVDALAAGSGFSLADLTTVVYDDVDKRLHTLAQKSLLAHLLKLQDENRVTNVFDKWRLP